MDSFLMRNRFYIPIKTAFGSTGIIWGKNGMRVEVYRILLPQNEKAIEQLIKSNFPETKPHSCPEIGKLGKQIQEFLSGLEIDFDLDILSFDRCTDFQKRALLAESKIPRGWVSTYGRIALHLGLAGGAQAVGAALSNNPFPIIIPCHRTVRTDGSIGGYQGGSKMKKALLILEGVEFSKTGKVIMRKVYY
jgi:methylated-DNA-[protein]-cysteine S-methyltransferase